MTQRRPKLSESVVKTLFALSRNVCSFIELDSGRACEEKLTDPRWKRVKAKIAHIRGLFPDSPRHDPWYENVNGFDNLLLVCPNHHTVIDDLEPDRYTVEVLEDMKDRSQNRADPACPWADDETLARLSGQLVLQTMSDWTAKAMAVQEDLKQQLGAAINRLDDREKIVLTLHYYQGMPFVEVAEVLGVKPKRVSTIHDLAMRELRSRLGLSADRVLANLGKSEPRSTDPSDDS